MAKNAKWTDDNWLLLMQIYLRKPVGVKPLYCKDMVNLSLELHIAPTALQQRMKQIDTLQTPRIERIWETYRNSPRKLSRAAGLLRSMKGYGAAEKFYEGVDVQETFELDFRPVGDDTSITPAMLILMLDLYFRLTPATMVTETPEIQELARLIRVTPRDVVAVMETFQHCDPYLDRPATADNPLMQPCQEVWNRYGNGDTEQLAAFAAELKEYFL